MNTGASGTSAWCGDINMDGQSAGMRGKWFAGIIAFGGFAFWAMGYYWHKYTKDDKRKWDMKIVQAVFFPIMCFGAYQWYLIRKECGSEPLAAPSMGAGGAGGFR